MNNSMENRGHIKRYSLKDVISYLSEVHGDRYKNYRREWELAGVGKLVPENPLYFFMEITSHCNLKCKMCYQSMKKDKHSIYNIPLEIIDNMLMQCKEMEVPSMIIGSGSESLIHPQIKEILRKCKESNFIDLILITNGQKLTKDISTLLIDLQIERLHVSIDAATSAKYRQIRGASLDTVERNVKRFFQLRQKRNSKRPFLRLSFVKMDANLAEIDLFYEKWKDLADIIDFQDYIDYSKVDKLNYIKTGHFICPDPFQRIGISWTGDIYPYCTFYQKHFKIGNIKNMSLKEAWESISIKALRSSFLNNKVNIACKNCRGTLQHGNTNVSIQNE